MVQSRPFSEPLACVALGEVGFAVFYPRWLRRGVRFGRAVESEAPLFPGYLFASFCASDVGSVYATLGVRRVIGGEEPVPVRRGEVEGLMEWVGPSGVKDFGGPAQSVVKYSMGQPLRVTEGAFGGLVGPVIESSEGRVRLLLHLLGREQGIWMGYERVEVVTATRSSPPSGDDRTRLTASAKGQLSPDERCYDRAVRGRSQRWYPSG